MATKEYSNNFASVLDDNAPNFEFIVKTAAGEHVGDYDIEQATEDYIEAVRLAVSPLGVDVFRNGLALTDVNADIDHVAVVEAAQNVDIYQILQDNDISGE